MSTNAEAAKREQPAAEQPLANPAALAAAAAMAPVQPPRAIPSAANETSLKPPGVDANDFVKNDRIHIKDGSLFIDAYLVIHPHELAPENEAKLRQKMQLTYSVNNPSFYESSDRLAVALNLAQLVPVSLNAKHSQLSEEIKKYNAQVASGADASLAKLNRDKQHPFAAIVRDTIEKQAKDPVGVETLKNGVAIYLLMRQKLTELGFRNPLVSYISHARTPDQVLSDLGEKIGVTPLAVREAALNGGIDGVGKLLGLDPAYVADVKQLTDKAAAREFSLNLIEHWHLGRQLLGKDATFEQKIATGMEARITGRIAEGRARVHQQYEVAAPIKKEEKRIAEALNLVEPIQRALMFKLGYEICFTPEVTADSIAFYPGIYGLHRKAANDLRDTRGTYRIYFAGRGDMKGSYRTLVHEIAHNLWPEQFTPQAVAQIDQLARSDADRFAKLDRMLDEKFPEFEKFVKAYQAASDAQKPAVAQAANEYFKPYGVAIDAAILPYIRDAHDLQFMVKHMHETLSVEGARYAKSGYDSPHERFREVISRFAELKQVELRGEPQLLQFLAPGLNQVWEQHYIPHLNRVYNALVQNQTSMQAAGARELPDAAAPAPKVEERPEPVKPVETKGSADKADNLPTTKVLADSIALSPQTLSALNTLDAMGVHTSATR